MGIRTRLLCGVSQGDLPLEISWSKDGQPLGGQQLDEFSSVVKFTNLSAANSGYYQCTARNAAGKAHYGTHLYVQGKHQRIPPKNPSQESPRIPKNPQESPRIPKNSQKSDFFFKIIKFTRGPNE